MSDKPKLILCPYCGNTQHEPEDRCQGCGGYFDDLSLRVTQEHMGPWFIRDRHHPFRPGCSYEVLVKEIERGKVKATTILRGPTTRQFWSVARNVPGVSHLLGYCHACGAHVDKSAEACGSCGEVFFAPRLRDHLGLAPAGAAVQAKPTLSDSGAFRAMSADKPAPSPPPAAPTEQPPATPSYSGVGATFDLPVGSSILAGLRTGREDDASPATDAVAEANASREALAWMTSDATEAPDTLTTAAEPTAALPARQTNYWTWLLILANLGLLIAAVAAVFIAINQPNNLPTPGPNPGPSVLPAPNTPVDPDVSLTPTTQTPDMVVEQPTPPLIPGRTPTSADIDTDADIPGTVPGPIDITTAAPTPGDGDGDIADPTDGSIFSVDTSDGVGEDARAKASWRNRFEEGQALERRGDLEDALRVYEGIKGKAAKKHWPAGLNDAIEAVKKKITRKEVDNFFE